MRLIDDSPGAFITMCFVVLYVTVAVEAAMLVSGSLALMWLFFVCVIAIAAGLVTWMLHLLDDGAPVTPVAAVAEPEREPAAPVQEAAPAPAPARAQSGGRTLIPA